MRHHLPKNYISSDDLYRTAQKCASIKCATRLLEKCSRYKDGATVRQSRHLQQIVYIVHCAIHLVLNSFNGKVFKSHKLHSVKDFDVYLD